MDTRGAALEELSDLFDGRHDAVISFNRALMRTGPVMEDPSPYWREVAGHLRRLASLADQLAAEDSAAIDGEPTRYPTAVIRAELEEDGGRYWPEASRRGAVTVFSAVTAPQDYVNPRTEPERQRTQFSTDIATARAIVRAINGTPWPVGEPYEDPYADLEDEP